MLREKSSHEILIRKICDTLFFNKLDHLLIVWQEDDLVGGCFRMFSWELRGRTDRQQAGLGRKYRTKKDQGLVWNGCTGYGRGRGREMYQYMGDTLTEKPRTEDEFCLTICWC
jgi:hypothetical protein